jgi:hypothetical protein
MTEITLGLEYQKLQIPPGGKVSLQHQSDNGYMVLAFQNEDIMPASESPGFKFPKLAVVTHRDDGSFVYIKGTVEGIVVVING